MRYHTGQLGVADMSEQTTRQRMEWFMGIKLFSPIWVRAFLYPWVPDWRLPKPSFLELFGSSLKPRPRVPLRT